MDPFVASLSPHLFWDTDRETIDPEKHRRAIIQRVLERGEWEDFEATRDKYSVPVIVDEARQMRSLEPTALSFVACLGNLPVEAFRCSATTPFWARPT